MGDPERPTGGEAVSEESNDGRASQTAVAEQTKPEGHDSTQTLVLKFLLPFVWVYLVIGIPLVILGFRDGWGPLFKSGEAAAFMCGAIVGALVENIIEQVPDKFAALKKAFSHPLKSIDETGMNDLEWYIAAFVLLAWNMYYAFSDTTVKSPGWDWVQLFIFVMTLGLLPLARFVFTAYDFLWLRSLLRLYMSLLSRIFGSS